MVDVDLVGDQRLAAGLRRVASRLDQIPPAAAQLATAAIRAAAPRRTGALASSITGHATAQGIAITTAVTYAKPVEDRTPYANPSLNRSRPAIEAAYAAHLQRLLDTL